MTNWKPYKERHGTAIVAVRMFDENEHLYTSDNIFAHGDYEVVCSGKAPIAMKKGPFEILYTPYLLKINTAGLSAKDVEKIKEFMDRYDVVLHRGIEDNAYASIPKGITAYSDAVKDDEDTKEIGGFISDHVLGKSDRIPQAINESILGDDAE